MFEFVFCIFRFRQNLNRRQLFFQAIFRNYEYFNYPDMVFVWYFFSLLLILQSTIWHKLFAEIKVYINKKLKK